MATDLPTNIQDARKRIVERVLDQCMNGAQSRTLPGTALACGQCIGETALPLMQRGLHGTTAAIRVLSKPNCSQEREVLDKLVHYVQDRVAIETSLPGNRTQTDIVSAKCELAFSNVIKVSELLYTLYFIPGDVPGRSTLIKTLSGILAKAKRHDKGWSFFTTTSRNAPELLPTVYAVLGLRRNGISVDGPAHYLFDHLTSRVNSKESRVESDLMIDVACLYALVFSERPNGRTHEHEYRKMLSYVWRPLYPLLQSDSEQNVEYWSQDDAFYVRVPWQLYLLALSAELGFLWKFRTIHATRCLDRVLNQTLDSGFIYPHSSSKVSTRTSAILFDAIGHIERNCDPVRIRIPISIVDSMQVLWDRAQTVLGNPVLRGAVFLGAGSIGLYAILEWLKGGGTLGEFGPGLILALIGWMYAFGARRNP